MDTIEMDTIEQHVLLLCERLADESRRLLALLMLGYSLAEAGEMLGGMGNTRPGIYSTVCIPQYPASMYWARHSQAG